MQEYTVLVPYTEFLTQTFSENGKTVTRDVGVSKVRTETRPRQVIYQQRVEVNFADAKFWKVNGKSLTADEAKVILAKPKRCFVLNRDPSKYPLTYPFYAEMFDEDVLMIWFDSKNAKAIPIKKTAPESEWKPGTLKPQIDFLNVATIKIGPSKNVLEFTSFVADRYSLLPQKISQSRFKVALNDLRVWAASGQFVSPEETRKLFSDKKRVFVVSREQAGVGDKFYSEMFRDDVYLVWYRKPLVKNKRRVRLPVLAAYSFTGNNVKKSIGCRDIELRNAPINEEGIASAGECYSEYFKDYSYIVEPGGSSIKAKVPEVSSKAFTISMRIKPKSFPGDRQASLYGGQLGTVVVGGAEGSGWLRLWAGSKGELSLIVGRSKSIDVGLSLKAGQFQDLVVAVDTTKKSSFVRVGSEVSTLKLPAEFDTALFARLIKFDPTFAFEYPIKRAAFHGVIKWFAVLDGMAQSDGPVELPANATNVLVHTQLDASKKNANRVISLTPEEENFRQALVQIRQSPAVYQVAQMMNSLQGNQAERLAGHELIFKDRFEQLRQRNARGYIALVQKQTTSLAELKSSNREKNLQFLKQQDDVAKGIGLLFFLSKQKEAGLGSDLFSDVAWPANFGNAYTALLKQATECFSKSTVHAEKSLEDLIGEAAFPKDVQSQAKMIKDLFSRSAIAKPSNNQLILNFSRIHSYFNNASRMVNQGKFDKGSAQVALPKPFFANLIGTVRSGALDADIQLRTETELKRLIQIKLDLQSYIQKAKAASESSKRG